MNEKFFFLQIILLFEIDLADRLLILYCKIIVRLLLANALNIKNIKRIKLDSNNTLLFNYLKYIETNC